MKAIVCICLIGMVAVAFARPNEQYTDKYDNVNVKEVLENDRLRAPYLMCVIEKGKCAPDAKELKSHIQEALENNCGKCTDTQKEKVREAIKYLINEKESEWKLLVEKYDPENKYSKKYEDELRVIKA